MKMAHRALLDFAEMWEHVAQRAPVARLAQRVRKETRDGEDRGDNRDR